MQDEMMFNSEAEYKEYVRQALEESEREAADPNTKRISWEEFRREVDAYFNEMESGAMAKSA